MKCNIPKPPKLPKSWHQLPQYEKDIINKALSEHAWKVADLQLAETQEIWIKLACILLHNNHGFDEEEMMQFIAEWKRIYGRNARIETKEEQTAWLEEEMKKCFPTCGFPQIRIDELKERTINDN